MGRAMGEAEKAGEPSTPSPVEPAGSSPLGDPSSALPHGDPSRLLPLGPEGSGADTAPLVATVRRWAAGSAGFTVGLVAMAEGILLFTHSSRALASLASPLALGAVAAAIVLVFVLRAEESRLARELRTARTGTPALRSLVMRRRVALPFLSRFASTPLGGAAVLLADGDREGAVDALARDPALMRGGRLAALRAIVEADLERSAGTSASLDRCIKDLMAAQAIGHREADRYRLHVLVKAILARGDGETGFAIASALSAADDEDARMYATWLRVWFDFDADADADEANAGAGVNEGDSWPALTDGDLRVAMLVARSHGAESLVSKLALRLSAIARPEPRG